jgi:hypothetical protein
MAIASETPEPITILCDDEIVHTDTHPFCSDGTCPCHQDQDCVNQFLLQPWVGGFLTLEEALRVFAGWQSASAS